MAMVIENVMNLWTNWYIFIPDSSADNSHYQKQNIVKILSTYNHVACNKDRSSDSSKWNIYSERYQKEQKKKEAD